MNTDNYKNIDVNGVSIAYTERGQGQAMLLVHGFASFSFTWMRMLEFLPEERFRMICIDLKGYGHSEKRCDEHLAPYDQAVMLSAFIRKLNLQDFILVGHSMGGAISLIALFHEEIRKRMSRLIIVDSAGMFPKLPEFIDDLTATSPQSPLLKYTDEELLARLVLEQAYHDVGQISEETVKAYADILREENAKTCLIAAAKQTAIPNVRDFHKNIRKIHSPTLIIWGENDRIINVKDAFRFRADLRNAELRIIPECGHSPQEEKPYDTACHICEFLDIPLPDSTAATEQGAVAEISQSTKAAESPDSSSELLGDGKLRMRSLIDRWSFGAVVILVFVKVLQFLKRLGFSAEENGWRKATGIFLRKEHSKFILACFRLSYLRGGDADALPRASEIIIERLAVFLRKNPACHWTLQYGFFMSTRKKIHFTDIIEVEFNKDGELISLVPHLDQTRENFAIINAAIVDEAAAKVISTYNSMRHMKDRHRGWLIEKRLRLWASRYWKLPYGGRIELRMLLERILNGTVIQFDVLDSNPEKLTHDRLSTPNLGKRKHPGSGLINVICRFTHDFKEADLWFQHHHVPVDGMPMQEMIEKLKEEWGTAGQIMYPALDKRSAMPEIFYFGDKMFRARLYVNFDEIIALRREVNQRYYAEMGGPATIASLIIWGLAHSPYFKESKFLFPVDTATIDDFPADRNISLLFIRPSRFFSKDKFNGFLRFQREFNHRMFTTRIGKSESYELLELYAMTHPVFYYIAKYFMPKALNEIFGTAGITIIKNAEMFVSPITDIQINGFMALGNLCMPTEDGKTAGAVSICGSREQVKEYIRAVNRLALNIREFVGLKP